MSAPATPIAIRKRAEQLFTQRQLDLTRRTDRLFGWLMLGQWLFGIVIALVFSPYGWSTYGSITKRQHTTWVGFDINSFNLLVAIFFGALLSSLPFALSRLRPGWPPTRYVIACAQVLWSALLIHLTGGRIETHFHVFGSLAFLAFYRDWKLIVPATVIVATDHFVRGLFWPESVYGMLLPEWWRFLEHAFWVVFEDVFLIISIVGSLNESHKFCEQQAHTEATERLEKEMEIAARIQTSLLPPTILIPGLEVAASMLPATEVGGDYYDVVPCDDGCWIAIGDVAGHGLSAGLVMLQVQSAVATLVRKLPDAGPREILTEVNKVIYDNVRARMKQDEHMTISLLRFHYDGRVVVAGAHEDIVIFRGAQRKCETVPTEGTWLGMMQDVDEHMVETEVRLAKGDVMVLYTDGVTEAMNGQREQFGLRRLAERVEASADADADVLRDAVVDSVKAWMVEQSDDVTLMVLRYKGQPVAAAAE